MSETPRTPLPLPVLAAIIAATAVTATLTPAAAAPIADARGITISCWRWGYEWATDDMRATMAQLPEVGANWVTIHPYAHVSRATGRVRWSAAERTDHIRKPIRWAKELGLRLMLKPHLSYWGEFDWRGDIGFGDDAERWQRFQETYHGWITHLAAVAAEEGADLFVVGTELRQFEPQVDYWRAVIKSVRKAYPGPLTYAANWDDFDRVGFWPELDLIGVQAYFPLTSSPEPSDRELRRGWQRAVAAMTALSEKHDRKVLLTEVGYPNADWAASTPWRTRRRHRGDTGLQARCLRTALDVAHHSDAIVGAFIWKWFPTTRDIGPADFTVQTREYKELLADVWSRGVAAPAATTTRPGDD